MFGDVEDAVGEILPTELSDLGTWSSLGVTLMTSTFEGMCVDE